MQHNGLRHKTFNRVVLACVILATLIASMAASVYHTPNYAMIGVGFSISLMAWSAYFNQKAKQNAQAKNEV